MRNTERVKEGWPLTPALAPRGEREGECPFVLAIDMPIIDASLDRGDSISQACTMTRKLEQELKKKRPFDSPEQEAMLNVIRTSDQLQIRLSRLFREHGLTPSQFNILRILRGEGSPLPILEIAQRTITVVPGITGLIDRLEQAGMVERQRCPKDRRVIFVALTEKGAKRLGELDRPVSELHARMMGHLPPAELRELSRLLSKVREGLPEEGGEAAE